MAERLHEWGLSSLAEDAQLVVSELVTNAVRHAVPRAAGDVLLSLEREPEGIRIAVIDPWRGFSLSTAPEALDEHGRGLSLVVGPLTDGHWGVEDLSDGKAVWARLARL
nr:ATP-binding protein [Allosalinactinospora lopnorensis]